MSASAASPAPARAPTRAGRGPWATALRKLVQDKAAMGALLVLLLIAAASMLASVYATRIARSDPFQSNISGTITIDGVETPLMAPDEGGLGLGVTPIGPTWHAAYFLGADNQGRDVAARMLYGGRNSLLIAFASTAICLLIAAVIGIVSGFFGGLIDNILSRLLDILWAFPVYLLAISLSIVLIGRGIVIGPITISAGSIFLPVMIIAIVYIPYVARPVRGQVMSLRQSEFVLAAICLGVPKHRILFRDILPNVLTTLIVFTPLMTALNMLTESALSFLSIGVQAPDASWGTIIRDGEDLIYTRPLVSVAPGLAIVVTVLALNVLGDGVRDALDPRARLRVKS